MDSNIIGTQITKYRKSAGLTQEELGRAVGVSTQAVSRWECGGAPDVALLPAIADKLEVTVDALFGREGGEVNDIQKTVLQWARTVPKGKMTEEMNRLLWTIVGRMPSAEGENKLLPYLESCEGVDAHGEKWLMCSSLVDSYGIYFGVNAEDMAFSTVFPEPERGYAAYFSDHDAYRKLFAVLAEPGSLEMLCYMLSRKPMSYSPDALAKVIGLDAEKVSELLERMEELRIVSSFDVAMPDRPIKVYLVRAGDVFVPLMYLSRCMMQQGGYNYVSVNTREEPLL